MIDPKTLTNQHDIETAAFQRDAREQLPHLREQQARLLTEDGADPQVVFQLHYCTSMIAAAERELDGAGRASGAGAGAKRASCPGSDATPFRHSSWRPR